MSYVPPSLPLSLPIYVQLYTSFPVVPILRGKPKRIHMAIPPFHTHTHTHTHSPPSTYQMCEVTISFLWHQVRCMVAVLFLIGHGLEKPDLIGHMLDIERKPQYGMASGTCTRPFLGIGIEILKEEGLVI